jgi:malonate decarboxylase gamma subunit
MHDVLTLCGKLFPGGHEVVVEGELLHGSASTRHGTVAVLGTVDRAAIGVDLAFALSSKVLDIVRKHPGRAIVMLVDTQGQRLSRRDELLGNAGYLAHLSKCFELARQRGHRLLSLVYGEAVSGGYLALGMIADQCFALEHAQIRVMALPAMSRIMQIPLERLEELCRTSAIFAPGVENYRRLGALDAVWSAAELPQAIDRALAAPLEGDARAARGAERGGRTAAQTVVGAMLEARA